MSDAHESLLGRMPLLVPINNLTERDCESLAQSATVLDLRKRDFVFRQGDRDNYTFYVLEGQVELVADDQLIKKVVGGEGASFHPLAQLQPRQMSAQARSRARVLRLDRDLLDKLLSSTPAVGADERNDSIEVEEFDTEASGQWLATMLESELFARIPPSNIQRLLATIETVEFKAGDDVIKQGDPGDYYYMVQSGTCAVLRTVKGGREIKLAELKPGDRFGEEALIADTVRSATVRMITDGELGRLTKADFSDLIIEQVLTGVSVAEGRRLAADGAVLLDVRFQDEHTINGIADSINIPLGVLRNRLRELDRDRSYIAYCDTGARSSAAAFLLAEEGFDAAYIEGGAIDELPSSTAAPAPARPIASPTAPAAAAPAAPPQPAAAPTPPPAPPTPAGEPDATEVERLKSALLAREHELAAKLAEAERRMEAARAMMDEAETAKREAENIVSDRLQAERARLEQDAKKLEASIDEAEELKVRAAEALRSERAQLQQENATLRDRLQEAEQLKATVSAQQRQLLEDAERRQQQVEAQASAREAEAERRLNEEKSKLDQLYEAHAHKLERLEQEREAAQTAIEQARQDVESESLRSTQRMQEALEREAQLERREAEQRAELEAEQQKLRAALEAEFGADRQRLEDEFARYASEVEAARQEVASAERTKEQALREARRLVTEFKEAQETLLATERQRIAAEQSRLQEEAQRLQLQRAEAVKLKAEAEQLKRQSEEELQRARDQVSASDAGAVEFRNRIAAIEERARGAAAQLRDAAATETALQQEQRENERRLEQNSDSESEIDRLLQEELDEWVAEQERIQSSTSGREVFARTRQQEHEKGIRQARGRAKTQQHDQNLLDEIAAQLGRRD